MASPRLPSPPPFTEVQFDSTPPPSQDDGAPPGGGVASKPAIVVKPPVIRRIRPGSKSRDISSGPPAAQLNELDSAFQLQEHLASLLTTATTVTDSPDGVPHSIPISKEKAQELANPPPNIDPQLWCYELTRRLTRDLNHLVVALLHDDCTSKTCPQMRASEWQYLCAVHAEPQSCCAIDYTCHTLDNAATVLTSSRFFPSRLSLTAQGGKHLSSIFRRLYRIFAHAWFQHRTVFWDVEGEWGLYLFFKTVSERYSLIPEDNLMIPPEAEGSAEISLDERDDFDRGTRDGTGSLADTGDHGDKNEDGEGGEEDDDDDFNSDESDESDEHSGSGSDGEGLEGEGGAFDLELDERGHGTEDDAGIPKPEERAHDAPAEQEGVDSASEDKPQRKDESGDGGGAVDSGPAGGDHVTDEDEESGEEVVLVLGDIAPPATSSSPQVQQSDSVETNEQTNTEEHTSKSETTTDTTDHGPEGDKESADKAEAAITEAIEAATEGHIA